MVERIRVSVILITGAMLPVICLYLSGVVVTQLVYLELNQDSIVFLRIILAWVIPPLVLGLILGALPIERPTPLGAFCGALATIFYLFLCVTSVYSASIITEFARNLADVLARLVVPVLSLALLLPIGAYVSAAIRSRLKGDSGQNEANNLRVTAGEFWRSLFPAGERNFALLAIFIVLVAVAVNYHGSRYFYRTAIGLNNGNQLDQAADAYRFYLKIWPFDDEAHVSLGHVYVKLGRDNQALDEWRLAEALNPGTAAIALHGFYRSKKQYVHALAAAKKIGQEYYIMEAYLDLAREYEEKHEFERAITTIREALGTNHKSVASWDVWIREELAWNLQQLGRFDEQVSELEKVVKLSPDDPELQISLGTAYINNRKFPEAFNAFTQADVIAAKLAGLPKGTDVPPRFPPGYKFIQIARIYSVTNEHRKAMENLELSVKADCKCPDAIANEKDFDSIRGNPKFQELLGRASASRNKRDLR